ncbi:lipase family alpha/beta hydrolase [Priestia megaterium]
MSKNITFDHQNGSTNLIIFIHGFTGGMETWKYNEAVSFPELLLENETIKENFDIACFNYHSTLLDFYEFRKIKNVLSRTFLKRAALTRRNLDIGSLGDILNTNIEIECASYQNIVFIAHSMGGLVAKSSILKLISNSINKVKLFISLGVPHNGTEWATFGKRLFQSHSQVINLAPLNNTLNEITNNWLFNISVVPQTIYFYGKHDMVVGENSAIGYDIEKQKVYFYDTDHYLIAKPESSDNLVYKGVTLELNKFLGRGFNSGDKWKSNVGQLYYINVPRLSELAGYLDYDINVELGEVDSLNSIGFLGPLIKEFKGLINKIEPLAHSFNNLKLQDIKVGYLAEFSNKFRSKNWSNNKDKLFKATHSVGNEPHLWMDCNDYKVILSLSPKWITTDTAFSMLANIADVAGLCRIKQVDLEQKVVYATPLFLGVPKESDFFESMYNLF